MNVHVIYIYCLEASACDPNPCVKGMCHVSDANNPLCTCADGYVGDTCNRLRVTVSDLPLLTINQRSSLLVITASPQAFVNVVINTVPPVTVSPSNLITISNPHTNASFYLQSSVESLVRLQFSVISDDKEVSAIEDKVTVASVVNAASTYFIGKSRKTLTEGCCKCDTNLTTTFCTGRPGQAIVLSSTCSWTVNSNNEYQSDGIIFVSVGTQSLPVSIIGTKIQLSGKGVAMDFTQPGVFCSSCSSPDCNSLSPQSIKDIYDMVKHQSMIITFLSAVEHVLPKHISIEAYGTSSKTEYSNSDYHTKILTGHNLQNLPECPNLLIDNTETNLYYVITTGSDLLFIYNNNQQYYTSTDRVCFVYPLCDDGSLFVSIPPKLSRQILNLTMFNNLLQKNWKINIKSIVTSHYGLSRDEFVSYWNGGVNSIILQPKYKLIAKMSITGGFHEQYLQVTFNFNGTATETNEVTSCQPVSMYTI